MSAHAEPAVYIVDHDRAFREALQKALTAAGHRSAAYADAQSFLDACDTRHSACIVAETRLPDMSGSELQNELKRRAIHCPVIFVTAHASVRAAVAALHNGAADYFEKPVAQHALIAAVEKILKLEAGRRREHARKLMIASALEKLTSREREIMRFVIAGKMNKTIADELRISIKTVEAHRARVMQKLGVDSVAALVQFALDGERARSGR